MKRILKTKCAFFVLLFLYSSMARTVENQDEEEEYDEELAAYERMQLMKTAAIEKFGQPHEVDPNFDPDTFSGVFLDYGDPSDSELNSQLPYNIQNVRDLRTRATKEQRSDVGRTPHFQPLCETHRRVVHLTDLFYDYRPPQYEEVHCVHPYFTGGNRLVLANVCNRGNFHCIQLNRTIHLTRRTKGSDCWELEQRVVPSGCECMWPKHVKGEIAHLRK